MKQILADKTNYGEKRDRNIVRYIVIHYTANNGDTAEGNGHYFQRPNLKASAHFFIDQAGKVVKSVPLDHVAWSVGGKKYADCIKTGGGSEYGRCTNRNSVSIELCDIKSKAPSAKQIKAVKNTIKYIKKYCGYATIVIRHFDVNGKHCPATMMDRDTWNEFKRQII